MNDKIVNIAADVLKITTDEAKKNSKSISEINGFYFWSSGRGGIAVIINSDGEKLAATSSISFEEHIQAFNEGRRN